MHVRLFINHIETGGTLCWRAFVTSRLPPTAQTLFTLPPSPLRWPWLPTETSFTLEPSEVCTLWSSLFLGECSACCVHKANSYWFLDVPHSTTKSENAKAIVDISIDHPKAPEVEGVVRYASVSGVLLLTSWTEQRPCWVEVFWSPH